jgi:hypothetical protein
METPVCFAINTLFLLPNKRLLLFIVRLFSVEYEKAFQDLKVKLTDTEVMGYPYK